MPTRVPFAHDHHEFTSNAGVHGTLIEPSALSADIDEIDPRRGDDRPRRPLVRRLSLAFDGALRNNSAARGSLRLVIREAVEYGLSIGWPLERIETSLVGFLGNHPRRDVLDRVSLLDGTRSSERLMDDVRAWIRTAAAEREA